MPTRRAHGNDLTDVTVQLHHETEKAWLVSGDGVTKVWVPKSQAELEASESNGAFILTLPEWLALDKGLI